MKNYENYKRLAKLMQNYKDIKKGEERFTTATIMEEVLKNESIINQKIYSDITKKIDDKKVEYKSEKQNVKKLCDDCKNTISTIINEEIMKDDSDILTDKLTFSGIGSINYKRVKKLSYFGTEAEKKELISIIINDGLYDLLDINEAKLIEFAKEIQKKNGQLPKIAGLQMETSIETKITTTK